MILNVTNIFFHSYYIYQLCFNLKIFKNHIVRQPLWKNNHFVQENTATRLSSAKRLVAVFSEISTMIWWTTILMQVQMCPFSSVSDIHQSPLGLIHLKNTTTC